MLFSGLFIDLKNIDPNWPLGLVLPQHQTERILVERAAELGVRIMWSAKLIRVEQDELGVAAMIEEQGELRTVRAEYLVGCDGGRSAVRQSLGIAFPGEDPTSHWVVADIQLDVPLVGRPFGRNTRIGTYQVTPVEPGWHRVSMMIPVPPTDRGAPVTLEELRQAMLEGIGTDYGLRHARWLSRFSDTFRQVEQYRHGRVFLAGDAAHIHPPVGGQGLNLGIQDAFNLGWKLGAVLKGGAAYALLDSYHGDRHPVAQATLQMTRAQMALIKPGVQTDALREVVGKMLEQPDTAREIAGIVSGLTLRHAWGEGGHPLLGCRIPDLALTIDEAEQSVFGLMHAGRPLFLRFDDSAPELPEQWRGRVDQVDVSYMADISAAEWRLPVFGSVPALSAAFVRPDGYVAWLSQAGEPASVATLCAALARWVDGCG